MVTARELADLFYMAENGNVCIRDGETHSETVKEMVFGADQSGLGWDFAYEAVRDCLYYLDDTEEDTDNADPDSLCDVYVTDLVAWLASAPLKHLPLCDEAAEDMQLSADEGLEARIRLGQYEGYRRAFAAIAENWPDDDDDETEDEEDGLLDEDGTPF